jgi:hypothetical protein
LIRLPACLQLQQLWGGGVVLSAMNELFITSITGYDARRREEEDQLCE